MKQAPVHPIVLSELLGKSVYLIDVPAAANKESTPPEEVKRAEARPKTNAKTSAPATLGGFGKGILIILQDDAARVISDDDLAFLSKILAAVKLSLEDVLIMNLQGANPEESLHWLEQHQPATVLMFGLGPEDLALPMRFPPFQVQTWGKMTFLVAPALPQINSLSAEATEQKKMLWQSLQRIFLQ